MFTIIRTFRLLSRIDNVDIKVIRSYLRRSAITYVILSILITINFYQYFRAGSIVYANLAITSTVLYLIDAMLLAYNSQENVGTKPLLLCIIFQVLTLLFYTARTIVTVISLAKIKVYNIAVLLGATIIFALVSIVAQLAAIQISYKLKQKLGDASTTQGAGLPVANASVVTNPTVNAVYVGNNTPYAQNAAPSAPVIGVHQHTLNSQY